MINEVNKHRSHRITTTSTSPGTSKYQAAYRIKITGLYHVTSIIETIYEKYNIRSRGITAVYDGLNAIKKSMDSNNTYPYQSNYFNLISTIDNKLMKYPLTWSWRHVKGHQHEQG